MNKNFSLMFTLLCAVAQGAWAQTTVSTDSELRSAIANDGANITVTADINLSSSTLSIESGKSITIDLGGHTLDRKLTQRGEGGGQVITVRNGATLNLSNGTLKSGWGGAGGALVNEGGTVTITDVIITHNVADDRGGGVCNRTGGTLTMRDCSITDNHSNDKSGDKGGGGLFNEEGATATLTNVTITGNEAKVCGGGGICNFGTLTLDACTIQDNSANTSGGGIWQEGTLNMQGQMTVSGNTTSGGVTNNLFLKTNALITVTGSLAGSNVGIKMEIAGVFTSGYNTNNSGVDPATIFTADLSEVMAVSLADNEAQLTSSLPDGSVYYIERSWDEENQKVVAQPVILNKGEYAELSGSGDLDLLPNRYYVVKGNVTFGTLHATSGGVRHLILCDDAKIEADFVRVEEPNTLQIYGQDNNSGKLLIEVYSAMAGKYAGIGGANSCSAGTIVIHGGDLNVTGHMGGAGIGGGSDGDGGNITINGGYIEANGGKNAAGIGSGWDGNGANIYINGGTVKAWGNNGGAGIGTGYNDKDMNPEKGHITVTGGKVYAYAASTVLVSVEVIVPAERTSPSAAAMFAPREAATARASAAVVKSFTSVVARAARSP